MQATRSQLMTALNAGKQLVREGRLDGGRLNRGFGIAQSRGICHIERYGSTATECRCPDRIYRGRATGQPCKGMLAVALRETK